VPLLLEFFGIHSEVGSLRDDDSVRSNSLRRAMPGSSETGQGIMEETRASNREVVKDTQRAMPPPREVRGSWHVVQEKPKSRDRAKAIADEEVESSEIAKVVEIARERESTKRQVPTTKATDWHFVRPPLKQTEETRTATSWTAHLLSCRKRRKKRGDYQ